MPDVHCPDSASQLRRALLCSYGTLCGLATPAVANSWPWSAAAPASPIPLPSSNFPFSLPFGVDFLLGHPFVTVALAVGVYVTVPRLWRLVVRYVVLPVLAIAAAGLALQHPAATLSIATTVFSCTCPHATLSSARTFPLPLPGVSA